MTELDPTDPADAFLLVMMRNASSEVAPGVMAHVVERDRWTTEIRAVLSGPEHTPGAVGRWLDELPTDRHLIVPAVVSDRLAGMLERRGFIRLRVWWDSALDRPDHATWVRRPRRTT